MEGKFSIGLVCSQRVATTFWKGKGVGERVGELGKCVGESGGMWRIFQDVSDTMDEILSQNYLEWEVTKGN